MLDLTQLLPFVAAALALNLTPGADMTYVIARSATQGRAAGIAASLGIAAGSVVHSVLAALGVSALLQHSETAFLVVKYAGAAYLLYLAWKAIRAGNRPSAWTGTWRAASLWRVFARGRADQPAQSEGGAVHPRLPAAIRRSGPGNAAVQILLLGLIFNIGGTSVNAIVAWSASAAAARDRQLGRLRPLAQSHLGAGVRGAGGEAGADGTALI